MEKIMAKYCAIGQCIMDLFTAYIERKNAENFNKLDYETFKQGKLKFKPAKPTQAALSKILNNNTSNISAYLKGQIKISKEMILDITEKLELNSEDFLKLAEQFALQENIMVLGPIPSHKNEIVSKKIDAINKSFINAITANLLFEILRKKYSSNLDEQAYLSNTLSSILDYFKDGISSYTIKEISKKLLR